MPTYQSYGLITEVTSVLCLRTKSHAATSTQRCLGRLETWLRRLIKDSDVPASHLLNESLAVSAGIPTIHNTLNQHLDSKDVGKAIEMVIQSLTG